jgi:prepilin-type N-terminal cleavage/methylation domain-containing protein
MPRPHSAAPAHGFTLVEMLVVLILTGLISGILFQALSQVFHLQSRIGAETGALRQQAMVADWFRQTIAGAQPDFEDGKNKFQASRRRIAGLTTTPLTAEQGALEPFTLTLEFDSRRGETVLRYGEGGDATALMAWPGDYGQFVFLDADHAEHEGWPPATLKKPAQLPAAVRLEGRRDGEPWNLLAVPGGPGQPRLRVRDVIGSGQP